MATVRRHVRIARAPDEVWDVLRDPASVERWFPGVVAAEVDGSQRVVTLASGMPMTEQIVTIDDDLRRFQYRLTTPVITEHLGTIDVIEDGDGSLVVYSTDIEPPPMAYVFSGATAAALAELRRLVETAARA
jgi:uncharacterized protein YndB with AHSA1/START domain